MMVSLGCTSLVVPDPMTEALISEQPAFLSAPRLSGVQRLGEEIAVVPGGVTNITAYEWYQDGDVLAGEIGDVIVPGFSGELSCRITAAEGVFETPSLCIRENDMPEQVMQDASLAIIPHSDATHISVKNGNWSDPETWDVGFVPAAGAVALLAHGHKVTYDSTSAVRLDRLRVDGWLAFSKSEDTYLKVETIYVSLTGKLTRGESRAAPIPQGVTSEIEFSNRSYRDDPDNPTDLRMMGDMMLMGRGLIAHGEITQYGAAKTTHAKVAAGLEPKSGDGFVTMAVAPENWQIGDLIDVVGTVTDMSGSTVIKTTERRRISDVSGVVITFETELENDHICANANITTNDQATLQCDAVNVTRNLIMRTENGENLPSHQRAHHMVMRESSRSCDAYCSFIEMGRTDKSMPTGVLRDGAFRHRDGPNGTAETAPTADMNLQSRYPFHFHRMGFGRAQADRPVAFGCVVDGSPGWGMVHHDCDADFYWCAITNFDGAGMVSESGNELGAWGNNISYGGRSSHANYNHIKVTEDNGGGKIGDFGRGCYPFFLRGRSLRLIDNVAADAPHGFVFYPRENSSAEHLAPTIRLARDIYDMNDLTVFSYDDMLIVDPPILHFADNEAYGVCHGLEITKSFSGQKHDLNIELKRFKAWNSHRPVGIEYIGAYVLRDFELYAMGDNVQGTTPSGKYIGNGFGDFGIELILLEQVAVINAKTVGFYQGIKLVSSGLLSRKAPGMALTADDFDLNDWRFNVTNQDDSSRNGAIRYETRVNDNTKLLPTKTCRDNTAVLTSLPPETDVRTNVPFIFYEWNGGPLRTDCTQVSGTYEFFKRDSYTESFVGVLGPEGDINGTADRFAEGEPGIARLPKVWDHAGLKRENDSGKQCLAIAAADGYYTYGADNIILMPLYFSDRMHATPHKFMHAIRCTGDMSGYTNNGEYVRSANAPVASPLSVVTPKETPITFNALTTTSADPGTTITLPRAFYTSDHGRTEIDPATGEFTYTPDPEFVGTDRIRAFPYDGAGHFTTLVINVTVEAA